MGTRKGWERGEARRLRSEGMLLKPIAAKLNVSVSSVHTWTKDIELSDEQRERSLRGRGGPQSPEHIKKRTAAWSARNRARRVAFQMEGRERARERDPLHMAGCMLYWAEGSKNRNIIVFANSDRAMVRFFTHFLKECFGITPEALSIRLNVYTNNGLSIKEIEDHWLEVIEAPRSCLRAHSTNHYPTSSSGRKRNLPYGVCTLKVARSTWLIQHIYGAIQEYASFEEPRWLDGPPRKQRKKKAA